MRYDTPVYFQKRVEPVYDPTTGNYTQGTLTETEVMASVSKTSSQTQSLIYGKYIDSSMTIHMQNKYTDEYESIRIGNKVYKVDYVIPLRIKEGLIISGS